MATLLESTLGGKSATASPVVLPGAKPATGSLLQSTIGSAPPSSTVGGYAKLGSAIVSGIGSEVKQLVDDVSKTANKPIRNWGDFWDLTKETFEEATRPARALLTAIPQAAVGAVSMPIQSAIQAATGKSTTFSLPLLGKFESYQDMQKQLEPQFGKGVSFTFPVIQEALNALAVLPGEGSVGNLIKRVLPDATPLPAVVRYLGKESKAISAEDLGTFENMTKLEAAKAALISENPKSINIQDMTAAGMTVEDAQTKAMQAIVDRAKTIKPSEHLDQVYKIAKTIGETPAEVAQSLPNYLEKYRNFQEIVPQIAERTGLPINKITLLREDTLTDADVAKIIDEVQKSPFAGGINEHAEGYANLMDKLYAKYPALQYYHNLLNPKMAVGGAEGGVGEELSGMTVEGFRGKQDLINRLEQIQKNVNHEITVPNDPTFAYSADELDPLNSAIADLRQGEPRGYKLGYSPLDYTPMVPKNYVPLPEQNLLGKVFDKLGLREVDSRAIKEAWRQKFGTEFDKSFAQGIVDKEGNRYDLGFSEPVYKKSGSLKVFGGKGNIVDKLYEIARARNDISITDISRADLKAVFGEAGDKLANVLADSRVLDAEFTGYGQKLVNMMRQNQYLDEFYKYTLVGRFGYSPGYAIRHAFKNQILGAFEGKPLNLLGFADTEFGKALINKFPKVFGGTLPTAEELSTLKKIVGNTGISLSPADEAWVYSHMGEALQDMAVKQAIESPNWIEKILGYTQTKDVMDLARGFAQKNGKTLAEIAEDPVLSPQLKDIIRTTYSYGSGIVSSPAIKTLNQIFYPIRFETKVLLNTAKWWANAPVFTRSAVVKLFNEGVTNSQTPQAKAFLKKNATTMKIISYLVPYTTMMDVFQDAVNAVAQIDHPSRALGSAWNSVLDNYQLGGLMFGLLFQEGQNQGLLPQTNYVDPSGKKYPIEVPKGAAARLKVFVADWLSFMWPAGGGIIGITPGGIGASFKQSIPIGSTGNVQPSLLPAKEKQSLQPGQISRHF